MARPKGYFLKDGTRVPGVTTILGRFKESGGLIHWAWNLGMQGIDYRDVRDSAAGTGHIVHDLAYRYAKGMELPDVPPEAQKPFEAFRRWAAYTNLSPGDSQAEEPMISEHYKYGGTPDDFFVDGKRTLLDWKTSNSVYGEYLCQLAAYRHLWIENHPDEPIDAGAHLIRFDKAYGDFHHHYYSDLTDAWEAFKHMRTLYELDKKLKKRVS